VENLYFMSQKMSKKIKITLAEYVIVYLQLILGGNENAR